jgi:hypothetical protein
MIKFLTRIKSFILAHHREYFVPALVLLFLSTYLISRPYELLIVFAAYVYGEFFERKISVHRFLYSINDFKKPLLIVGVIILLVFSFFNTRLYSYDGYNFHIRVASLVKDNGLVSVAHESIKPYFGELVLGYTWRYFGLRTVNLMFGIWAVTAGFLGYVLIKKIAGTNSSLVNSSFMLFILSPPFLAMALQEFKPDLFLLIFVFSAFIILINFVNSMRTHFFLLLCLLSGVAITIKTSIVPTAFLTVLFCAVYFLKKKGFKTFWLRTLLGIGLLFSPLLIWSSIFGFTVPLLENYINVSPLDYYNRDSVTLTREPATLDVCYKERIQKDYSSFIYGARSPLVLIQPFFYLTRLYSYPFSVQGMANPGPFIYLGMFIFIIFPFLVKHKKFEDAHKMFYVICTTSLLIFLVTVSSIYWYLLFMFPLICFVFVSVVDGIENARVKSLLKKLINAWLVSNVLIFFLTSYTYFHPISEYSYENLPDDNLKSMYILDKRLEELGAEALILDASEHGDFILMPFMKNNDTRIIKSNYYFVSSGLSLGAINRELKDNAIKYIVVNYDELDSPWYQDCPKENNTVLKNYLNLYTKPIFFESGISRPMVFEIVN